MKLIHNGTVIQASFSVVDDDGDVLQTVVVQPAQDQKDPLRISKITEESFKLAYEALANTKVKMEQDLASKQEVSE